MLGNSQSTYPPTRTATATNGIVGAFRDLQVLRGIVLIMWHLYILYTPI